MKLLMLLAAGLIFCGCSNSAKERALEKRVAALECELSELRTNLVAVLDKYEARQVEDWRKLEASNAKIQAGNQRVLEHVEAWPDLVRQSVETEVQRVLEARDVDAKLVAGKPIALRAAPARAEPLKDGVPISVWNQISAAAAKEWPGDFRMQAYVIKNQTEAWQKLHR
jgi:hypothetical protein